MRPGHNTHHHTATDPAAVARHLLPSADTCSPSMLSRDARRCRVSRAGKCMQSSDAARDGGGAAGGRGHDGEGVGGVWRGARDHEDRFVGVRGGVGAAEQQVRQRIEQRDGLLRHVQEHRLRPSAQRAMQARRRGGTARCACGTAGSGCRHAAGPHRARRAPRARSPASPG